MPIVKKIQVLKVDMYIAVKLTIDFLLFGDKEKDKLLNEKKKIFFSINLGKFFFSNFVKFGHSKF